MNSAMYGETIGRECAADSIAFGSLEPWMRQGGRFETGELRAAFGPNGVAPATEPRPELTLAALQISDRLLRQFFDESPIGIAVFDAAGWLVQLNPAFAALLEYAVPDLVGRNIEDLMHPCDIPLLQERRRMLIEGRCEEFRIATRFATAKGREISTRMCGRLEPSAGAQPPHVFAHIVDFAEGGKVNRSGREADWMNWDPDRYMD